LQPFISRILLGSGYGYVTRRRIRSEKSAREASHKNRCCPRSPDPCGIFYCFCRFSQLIGNWRCPLNLSCRAAFRATLWILAMIVPSAQTRSGKA